MQFEEYRRHDAIGLAELIRRREVSADELLQTALARLDAVNPRLNLLAHDFRGQAQATPASTDPAAPLAGVPFLLKDLLSDWAGMPTTGASRMMQGYVARQNSYLTQSYLDAGLRIFGRTTSPELGLNACTESDLYGVTRNPWSLAHTPGGSSGGSAAAVAAGIVPVAHGGDGGGSIRLPAHNCGLFGLKPSRGRISLGPQLLEAWQGAVSEHVLSRSVRDSALFLDIAARTQPRGFYACRPAVPFLQALSGKLPRLKIACWQKPWMGGDNDEPTRRAFAHSLKLLGDAGHHLEEATPAFAAPETLLRAVRVLVAAEAGRMARLYRQRAGQPLQHRQVEAGTWALMVQGRLMRADELAWARGLVLEQTMAAERFFERYDVLMTPVTPCLTPRVGELMPKPHEARLLRLCYGTLRLGWLMQFNPLVEAAAQAAVQYVGYTTPFNLSGCPAMSVPLYWHGNLPIGTQFAARHGFEDTLLKLAVELEQRQPWAGRWPSVEGVDGAPAA